MKLRLVQQQRIQHNSRAVSSSQQETEVFQLFPSGKQHINRSIAWDSAVFPASSN